MLTPIVPAPTGNGLAMRSAVAVEALRRLGSLTVVVIPVADFAAAGRDSRWIAERCDRFEIVDPVSGSLAAVEWLSSERGRQISRMAEPLPERARGATPALGDRLQQRLGEEPIDLVYTLRLYLAGAALGLATACRRADGDGAQPRLALDLDENDAVTLTAIAGLQDLRGESGAARRVLAEAHAFERFAAACLPAFDDLLVASGSEAASLAGTGRRSHRARVLPNAVVLGDRPVLSGERGTVGDPPWLVFVGNFSYLPNLDAAQQLVLDVLPLLRNHCPGLELHLIGRGGGSALEVLGLKPGVVVHGFVEDLLPHYQAAAATVVPLRAGGGSRVKILEAAAAGVPVIATPVAAAGLDRLVEEGALRLATSAAEMAQATLALLADSAASAALSRRAWGIVAEDYSVARVSADLADFLESTWSPGEDGR